MTVTRPRRRTAPPAAQALYGAGKGVVRLFSAVDQRLEESGIFSRLLPEEIPKCTRARGEAGAQQQRSRKPMQAGGGTAARTLPLVGVCASRAPSQRALPPAHPQGGV